MEEFRGRGFATICMKFMSNHVQNLGMTPFTFVEQENHASIALMEKLGFEPEAKCAWVTARTQK